jgi:hypothetical protein
MGVVGKLVSPSEIVVNRFILLLKLVRIIAGNCDVGMVGVIVIFVAVVEEGEEEAEVVEEDPGNSNPVVLTPAFLPFPPLLLLMNAPADLVRGIY